MHQAHKAPENCNSERLNANSKHTQGTCNPVCLDVWKHVYFKVLQASFQLAGISPNQQWLQLKTVPPLAGANVPLLGICIVGTPSSPFAFLC
jgi:hypothetical protein